MGVAAIRIIEHMQNTRVPLLGAALVATFCFMGPALADDLPHGGDIRCLAPFSNQETGEGLLARYGQKAKIEEIAGLDGEAFDAVVLYADDPRFRLEVEDRSGTGKERLTAVNVKGRNSLWTVEGLKTGMTLKELSDANGGAVTLSGFWQETETTFAILGWLPRGNCEVVVVFMAPDRVSITDPLYGKEIRSDDPRLSKYGLRIDELTLRLPASTDD